MKIALVHDSLTQLGGAERVLEALRECFPDAPLFTLVLDRRLAGRFQNWRVVTSWLQGFYNLLPRLQYWLIFIPAAVRSLGLPDCQVVLSSSSAFAKGVKVPKGAVHISYCHTPTRFLWTDLSYVNEEVSWPVRPLAKLFLRWLRRWDLAAAQRVDHFIANSREVQQRIERYYHKPSTIIHPYVDTRFWHSTRAKQNYFLIGGRLHAHKDNQLIVELFNELGWELHVVGTGRREKFLQAVAKPNIKFLGPVPDEVLRDEYSGARGFIYPHKEDFGLMPLEAAACGTATLALGQGGSLETVIPGVTGELFPSADPRIIKKYFLEWDEKRYNQQALQDHAVIFSKDEFIKKIRGFVEQVMLSGGVARFGGPPLGAQAAAEHPAEVNRDTTPTGGREA